MKKTRENSNTTWETKIYFSLQEISWSAFRNLRILVELDLSHNNLTHLEPETFSGNERLQTLSLSHNKIAQIAPYVFPPLKHLKTIDLSHNFLDEIHRNTFENLGNSVEALHVDNNRLSSLREQVFLPLTNLKSLQVPLYSLFLMMSLSGAFSKAPKIVMVLV